MMILSIPSIFIGDKPAICLRYSHDLAPEWRKPRR